MREINLNIEGFNVNGICVACLNYGRKMFYDKQVDKCLKLLGNIDIPEDISVQVCWECLATVRELDRFQGQINRSFDILLDYSRKHTYLNSPSDLWSLATQRLSVHTTHSEPVECNPWELMTPFEPKEEVDEVEIKVPQEEYPKIDEDDFVRVKSPIDEESHHADAAYSSEDDIKLSAVKKEKEPREPNSTPTSKKHKTLKHFAEGSVSIEELSLEAILELRERDRAHPVFLKLRHRCDACVCAFNSDKVLKHHVKSRHRKVSSRPVTQCDICQIYMTSTGNVLQNHRRRHFGALRCVNCGFRCVFHRVMEEHLSSHELTATAAVSCDSCHETFPSKRKLSYHRGVCKRERPQCDCCGKVYANKATLRFHLRSQQAPKEKPKEESPITCKECGKVLSTKKGYRAHMEIHRGTKFPCPICGALFTWRRNLARHAHAHADRAAGARHRCAPCGRSFASRECLSNHLKLSRQHGAESFAHACDFCGKKFAAKYMLTDHVDWEHVGKIKYTCDVCRRPFKTLKVLTNHVKNIHGGRKGAGEPEGSHLCEICGKSYTTVKRLKGHVWAMHTNRAAARSYRCAACPATFMWQSSVYKHYKCMHADRAKEKPARTVTKVEETQPVYETLQIVGPNLNKQYF